MCLRSTILIVKNIKNGTYFSARELSFVQGSFVSMAEIGFCKSQHNVVCVYKYVLSKLTIAEMKEQQILKSRSTP